MAVWCVASTNGIGVLRGLRIIHRVHRQRAGSEKPKKSNKSHSMWQYKDLNPGLVDLRARFPD